MACNMINEIIFRESGNTIVGELASKLYFGYPEKMKSLSREVVSGKDSLLILKANYWVVDSGCVIRATQSTREGAMRYMGEDRVLLSKGE